jgi:hypothetical protein
MGSGTRMQSPPSRQHPYTAVHVPLWFYIPLQGSFTIAVNKMSIDVSLASEPETPQLLERFLKAAGAPPTLSVRALNDPRGRERFTIVNMAYPCRLSFPTNRRLRLNTEKQWVATAINYLIDAVRYHMPEFHLPRVSHYDLSMIGFAPLYPGKPIGEGFCTLVDHPWGVSIAEDGCHYADAESLEALRDFLRSGTPIPPDAGYLLDAYENYRSGNYPHAIVDAVIAIEITLTTFLRSWLRDANADVLRRVSCAFDAVSPRNTRLQQALTELNVSELARMCGVSRLINVVETLLEAIDIAGYDKKQVFAGARSTIKARNKIVHEGLRNVADRDVVSWLSNISILMVLLRSASFDFGVRIPIVTLTSSREVRVGQIETKPIQAKRGDGQSAT